MVSVETTPGTGVEGREMKENGRRGDFMYNIFDTL
jgi:hypothetical protein